MSDGVRQNQADLRADGHKMGTIILIKELLTLTSHRPDIEGVYFRRYTFKKVMHSCIIRTGIIICKSHWRK